MENVIIDLVVGKFPIIGDVFQGALLLTGFFSWLATVTPNSSSKKVITKVLAGINFLGCNWGKSKNK